jgi:predicted aldo/keto reductase-like oxidoreductase
MEDNIEITRKPRSAAKKAADLTAAILAPKVEGKRRGRPPSNAVQVVSPVIVSKEASAVVSEKHQPVVCIQLVGMARLIQVNQQLADGSDFPIVGNLVPDAHYEQAAVPGKMDSNNKTQCRAIKVADIANKDIDIKGINELSGDASATNIAAKTGSIDMAAQVSVANQNLTTGKKTALAFDDLASPPASQFTGMSVDGERYMEKYAEYMRLLAQSNRCE